MGRRALLLSIAAVAIIAVALPAPAYDVICGGEGVLGISVDGVIDSGPGCVQNAACPTSATSCDLEVRGTAEGVGYVGMAILINDHSAYSCTGPASCDTGTIITVNALSPGERVRVEGKWAPGPPADVTLAVNPRVFLEVAIVER